MISPKVVSDFWHWENVYCDGEIFPPPPTNKLQHFFSHNILKKIDENIGNYLLDLVCHIRILLKEVRFTYLKEFKQLHVLDSNFLLIFQTLFRTFHELFNIYSLQQLHTRDKGGFSVS